jgi:hypothetical protein
MMALVRLVPEMMAVWNRVGMSLGPRRLPFDFFDFFEARENEAAARQLPA